MAWGSLLSLVHWINPDAYVVVHGVYLPFINHSCTMLFFSLCSMCIPFLKYSLQKWMVAVLLKLCTEMNLLFLSFHGLDKSLLPQHEAKRAQSMLINITTPTFFVWFLPSPPRYMSRYSLLFVPSYPTQHLAVWKYAYFLSCSYSTKWFNISLQQNAFLLIFFYIIV